MKILSCKLCEKHSVYEDELCKYCYDAIFYLENIIKEYFSGGTADPIIINALREFSWFYAGYPRFWGYYNSIIHSLFYFIINPKTEYITEVDLDYFKYTTLKKDDILEILYGAKIIEKPKLSSPGVYGRGDLSRTLSRKITEGFREGAEERKDAAEEMFGFTSVILTYLLIKRKFNNPDEKILPRKAISIFITFAYLILENYNATDEIPSILSRDTLEQQQKNLKVSSSTQLKSLYEMLGLSYISPGITNIIDGFGESNMDLRLKPTIINLLENLRERRRERERMRSR